jgi:hypothetical protein
MPTAQNAHIDRALTNMSVAYLQDASNYIADKVFPIIPVKRQTDLYYIYNTGDFLRDEAQTRGAIAESAGGDYEVSTDTYHCKVHAFHKDVSPQDLANYDEPLDADKDALIYVSQKILIRREMEWASQFFKTGAWTRELAGASASDIAASKLQYWNTDNSNPIADITGEAVRMASLTGYRPNTLVLSPYVFNALKNHYDVLDRVKYTETGIVTEALLASLFEVKKVLVAWAVVNTGAKGASDNIDFIMGKNALLCYSNPTPSLRSPSAGYIYSWTGLEGAGAYGNRIIRLPMDMLGYGVNRIEGEIAFAAKKVGDPLGVFFKDIVS